tara:strand:+ start:67 stop:198 length:132 start_codon:yes stop_codon:yes gene_type:complete
MENRRLDGMTMGDDQAQIMQNAGPEPAQRVQYICGRKYQTIKT